MAFDGVLGSDATESQQLALYCVSCVFFALATLSVVLRFWARRIQNAELGVDDWLSLAGLILAGGILAVLIIMISAGMGRHTAVVMAESPESLPVFLKALYAGQIIYALNMTTIKLSVIFLYRRIFITPSFQKYLSIIGLLCIAWAIAFFSISIFACQPVSGFWNKTLNPPAACLSKSVSWVSNGAANIVTESIILALPVKTVLGLRIRRAQKIGLILIFLLGAMTTIISAVRVWAILSADEADTFWNFTKVGITTGLEPFVGTISACLPTLRPVAAKVWPSVFRPTLAMRSSDYSVGKPSGKYTKPQSNVKHQESSMQRSTGDSLDDNDAYTEHILTTSNKSRDSQFLPIQKMAVVT